MSLEKILNERIADFGVLYIKLHRFHWYVEGSNFYSLHLKFEELYNETTLFLDEYAERLLSIDGKPIATLKQFLEFAIISEDGNEKTPDDMIKTLINDYTLLVDKLKEGVKVAENSKDLLTADLFIRTIGIFEKHLWMLKKSAI